MSNLNTLAVRTGPLEVVQSFSYVSEHLGFCYPFVLSSDLAGMNHLKTFNGEGGGRERERFTEL